MDNLRTYRVGIGIAVVFLLIVGWFAVKPAATNYPPYFAASAQPDGIKAILMLLEEKGGSVREWRQPMRFLPNREAQLLLSVEPRGMLPSEVEDIISWIEQGNHLILFEKSPQEWEDIPFFTKEIEDTNSKERNIRGALLGEGSSGLAQAGVRLIEDESMETLLYDDQGILAGRIQMGKGSMTLFLVPDWMTNAQIQKWSHFEAIWPYIQGDWSVVWVDEYHHGLQEKPGLLAIYPGWLVASCIQLAAALLLLVWWQGKRFGPVYTLREWTVRRGDETLLAIARWYEQRGLARDALLHREAYLRQLIHDRWGVHQRADRAEIVRVAKNRWNESEVNKLDHSLQQLEQTRAGERYTTKKLLADSQLLDELCKRLEKE
ncbi:hypothetical protein BRE01_40380 [Brevibacillus reuszeri]|uniref:DUF4350 domain-containing protein n=1 Tax=Brevibacillus reuszeri TaxID=54915 RepID=A0A0K9YVF6_9BACL|nr:DUF4350 domain-containing protein [Brevibacillus reuszeri]KNB72637.1 hypothetical protein ADS79_12355 [Brevibacillus reuszeri]MED1860669.1 DUF4350 domain-containing protein [Brevibacillus reuszeri]GED70336.1 hypothetical protein BRE01_40380 [Brevibacillus reuszeri]